MTAEDEGASPYRLKLGMPTMQKNHEKIRENRLRAAARRQNLILVKSRRRDTRAADYGTYMLMDGHANTVVAYGLSNGYGLSLDDVESALST